MRKINSRFTYLLCFTYSVSIVTVVASLITVFFIKVALHNETMKRRLGEG